MEWLEMEGKTAEAKREVEKADKRRNPYRYEADVLLTGLREWDRRLKAPEIYLQGMSEAREPVDSPAYQWFVRLKYMPIFSQLEDGGQCVGTTMSLRLWRRRCDICSIRR